MRPRPPFRELMPDQVDDFFVSLTDAENFAWQKIYLQQTDAFLENPNITFEELDKVASDVDPDVAERMLAPRTAIFEGIKKLKRSESRSFVSQAHTTFRWMRMKMGDREKVLGTLLAVSEQGCQLPPAVLSDIGRVFPVVPTYLQDPDLAILLKKFKTMKIKDLYDEMVDESIRVFDIDMRNHD
ncbi:hypothetical protein L596_011331 [Steinernema carpocapsae]|uniref:Uncharacterized protein n=1 Tax=Steinernema carpocapsae TaxID=34508 RepID=A0A4V6A4G3_STECR|nr:hypothetical protein L596_011331 [Steinernema carpocapsae]